MTEYVVERIITKSSNDTVKVNGYFLHSKYDPIREADLFADKNYKPNFLHILFGYGLGYFYNALHKKVNPVNEEIIVIDPIYNQINGEESQVPIFKDLENPFFIKFLQDRIERYNRRVHVIQSPNYGHFLGETYKRLLEMSIEKSKLNRINENTIKVFAEDWQKNYIFNLYHAVGDPSLMELQGKYDIPIVIASGGPSLTKQLNLLKEMKEKIFIIAAGSTINTLLRSGIVPDFVVSVDGKEKNYNHYKDIKSNEITYLYTLASHYGIRESFEKAYVFNVTDKEKMNMHFERLTSRKFPVLSGGGSVANFAFTIATYITKGPIAMIGQDLAYTDNKTHAENNKNFKLVDDNFKKKRETFYAEGYYGDEVLTDYVFLSMKDSFEQLMKVYGEDRLIFNCTEGGIDLKGFEKLPFQDFYSKYVVGINRKPELPSKQKVADLNKARRTLHMVMREEILIYKKTKNLLVDNLNLLRKNNSTTHFANRTLKKLNVNDDLIKEYLNEVSISSIINPITIHIQNDYLPKPGETSTEAYTRVYNQNKDLYSKLIDAIDLTVRYTNELLSKIEEDEVNINGTNNQGNEIKL